MAERSEARFEATDKLTSIVNSCTHFASSFFIPGPILVHTAVMQVELRSQLRAGLYKLLLCDYGALGEVLYRSRG